MTTMGCKMAVAMITTFPSSVFGLESYPTVVIVIRPHLSITNIICRSGWLFSPHPILHNDKVNIFEGDKILFMVGEVTKSTRQRSRCRFVECVGWCSSRTLQPAFFIIIIVTSCSFPRHNDVYPVTQFVFADVDKT